MKRFALLFLSSVIMLSLYGCTGTELGDISLFVHRFNETLLSQEISAESFIEVTENEETEYICFLSSGEDEILLKLMTNDEKNRICSVELTYSGSISQREHTLYVSAARAACIAFTHADRVKADDILGQLGILKLSSFNSAEERSAGFDEYRCVFVPNDAGGSLYFESERLMIQESSKKPDPETLTQAETKPTESTAAN